MTREQSIQMFKHNYCENKSNPCMITNCKVCAVHEAIEAMEFCEKLDGVTSKIADLSVEELADFFLAWYRKRLKEQESNQ